MELIETVELASSASSITFSSIPQTYTDLLVKIAVRNDTDNDVLNLEVNGSDADISLISLRGEGTSVISQSETNGTIKAGAQKSSYTANTFSNASLYISNYTSSNAKSLSWDGSLETNGTDGRNSIQAILFNNTSAITSIGLLGNTNLIAGCTASLYGITAGSDGTTTVS